MSSIRLFLVAVAGFSAPLFAACGGSSDSDTLPTPTGAHHGYVVSTVTVPADIGQAGQFALDFGTKTSSKPDGMNENAIGTLLATLHKLGMLDIQTPITQSVDRGDLLLLIDVQADSLTSFDAAGFRVLYGATPAPLPCASGTDTTCRQHLQGTGTFTIAPGSPTDAVVAGKISGSAFTGGPGDLAIKIALAGATLDLTLIHARVQAGGISDAGIMTATLGGLVLQSDLVSKIGPALTSSLNTTLMQDCTHAAGGCQCTTDNARTLLGFDTNGDCALSMDELFGNLLVAPTLKPDTCSMDTCSTPDSLSMAIQVQAVKASFPAP
jgi:hypothetical protein